MANINDLRTSGVINLNQAGMRPNHQAPQNQTSTGFTPSIVQGEQEAPKNGLAPHMAVGVSQGDSNIEYAERTPRPSANPKAASAGYRKAMTFKSVPKERVAADFSSIPKTNENMENAGVTMKTSYEDEIFKPGGPFDQYIKNKKEEARRDIEQLESDIESADESGTIDLDNNDPNARFDPKVTYQVHQAALENDKKESNEYDFNKEDLTDIDEDTNTTISQATSYRQVDIMGSHHEEGDEEMPTVNEDDFQEPVREEVHKPSVEQVQMEHAVPEDNTQDSYTNAEEVVKEEGLDLNTDQEAEDAHEFISPVKPVAPTPAPKKNIADRVDKITRHYMAYSDNEEETASTDTSEDEDLATLKSLITEKIAPVSKKLDLSTFTIAKRGTTSNTILATTEAPVAKWVLPSTGTVIQMREISGANLELMRSYIDRRPQPDMRSALKIIYDHIVSPKAKTFDLWLNGVAFADYDNLFMAIYIASFADANYMPVDCQNPGCHKAYLTDNIPIMDMVKFKDKDSETKFWNLYNSDVVESNGLYTTEVAPISNKFAIAFQEPSLYSVLIENSYFNDEFRRKYGQTIDYMPYIDTIYYIDAENRTLVPIDYKSYDNNIARTARSKAERFDKVLNTFNADQHAIISAYINKINERIDWFSYQIPETTCPNCGHVNPASENQSASSMVFLRNRLGVLATI